jgi:hypothetical protein
VLKSTLFFLQFAEKKVASPQSGKAIRGLRGFATRMHWRCTPVCAAYNRSAKDYLLDMFNLLK